MQTWRRILERWVAAGLVDPALAERIRTWEAGQEERRGLRWPVLIAVSFGGILVGAGVLLFVAAHWDDLSPSRRFALVLLMVAIFHAGGAAAAERFSVLATALHATGTVALGAGVFMAGQIFNLGEHWPGGIMLWAAGAWVGWALRRDWTQATLAAVLTPAWLAGEWIVATEKHQGAERVLAEGLLLVAVTYLSSLLPAREGSMRRALAWIGGLAVIPLTGLVVEGDWGWRQGEAIPTTLIIAGWTFAIALPLALAFFLRGQGGRLNMLAAAWVVILGTTKVPESVKSASIWSFYWDELGSYLWCMVGAVGLVAWGAMERRKERINLGIAGFGLTVLIFYSSSVMDKLGRATSLIGLGVMFLAGGWILERTRRRLVAGLNGGDA